MVVLGLDFGMRHMGVSLGDTISRHARPLTGFTWSGESGYLQPIAALVERWQPEQLVVGLPLNADGTPQQITMYVKQFVAQCEKRFALPVALVDERWSTVEAKAYLYETKKNRDVKKSLIDAESATVILAQWLNAHE